jgi:hypothetical protein
MGQGRLPVEIYSPGKSKDAAGQARGGWMIG